MPEAVINEYCKALAAENEIGVPRHRLVSPPAGDAGDPQNGRELQLGGFVASRANSSHDLRALFLRKYIGHGGSLTAPDP
jgi:hypothetical protein